MEKVFVAQRVAKQLWATEGAIDGALLEASTLMREIIEARAELKLASVFGDEVNVKLMDAMQALTEARTAMLGVHTGLHETQLRLGIRTKMEILSPVTSAMTQIEEAPVRRAV